MEWGMDVAHSLPFVFCRHFPAAMLSSLGWATARVEHHWLDCLRTWPTASCSSRSPRQAAATTWASSRSTSNVRLITLGCSAGPRFYSYTRTSARSVCRTSVPSWQKVRLTAQAPSSIDINCTRLSVQGQSERYLAVCTGWTTNIPDACQLFVFCFWNRRLWICLSIGIIHTITVRDFCFTSLQVPPQVCTRNRRSSTLWVRWCRAGSRPSEWTRSSRRLRDTSDTSNRTCTSSSASTTKVSSCSQTQMSV